MLRLRRRLLVRDDFEVMGMEFDGFWEGWEEIGCFRVFGVKNTI